MAVLYTGCDVHRSSSCGPRPVDRLGRVWNATPQWSRSAAPWAMLPFAPVSVVYPSYNGVWAWVPNVTATLCSLVVFVNAAERPLHHENRSLAASSSRIHSVRPTLLPSPPLSIRLCHCGHRTSYMTTASPTAPLRRVICARCVMLVCMTSRLTFMRITLSSIAGATSNSS